jgi:endonuclease I
VSGSALADPPPGYYDSVDVSTPVTLRLTLHEVIDDHQRFPYSSGSTDTWDILEAADEDPADPGRIVDVYRNRSIAKFGGGTGPYNREHTWPRSYGFPDDNPQNYPHTDCHHLFLCDPNYNSNRENKPYRYCSVACTEWVTVETNGRGGGSGSYPGNSNWTSGTGSSGTWETWMGRRGDVARALFYLDVRYEGGTHGGTGAAEPDLILTDNQALITASNTGNNLPVAYMGILSVLYEWHLEDPVDDVERYRNDVVFSYQGNRNPFVDHPEWVGGLITTGITEPIPPLADLLQNYPDPFNPRTTIVFDLERPREVRLVVFSIDGRPVVTLLQESLGSGRHQVFWDGRDGRGRDVGSGVYVYRLTSSDLTMSKRMILLR